MYTTKGYLDILEVQLNLQLMGHMGMIMDEKNLRMYNEEVISCKCNCSIVARLIKGVK